MDENKKALLILNQQGFFTILDLLQNTMLRYSRLHDWRNDISLVKTLKTVVLRACLNFSLGVTY